MSSDKLQVLISIHNEYRSQARWLEDRRENTSKMIIAANLVLLGFIVNAEFEFFTLALSPLIFVLANWGQYFSAKYFLLSERDYARARVIRDQIDIEISSGEQILVKAFSDADQDENQNVYAEYDPDYIKKVRETSLHLRWLGIHKAFKLISIVVSIIILANLLVQFSEIITTELAIAYSSNNEMIDHTI